MFLKVIKRSLAKFILSTGAGSRTGFYKKHDHVLNGVRNLLFWIWVRNRMKAV
jgi:hypothetical protein